MQRRRQDQLLSGALLVALVLLGACTSDGGAEDGLADSNGSRIVAEEGDNEPEPAGEGAATIEVEASATGESVTADGAEPATDDQAETGSATATESEPDPDGDAGDGTVVVGDQPAPSAETIVEEVGEVLTETGQGLDGPELEQYLARRYEAYWQAFDLARQAPTESPTTDYPALASLAAGEQLDLTYSELADLSELGHAIREPDTAAVPGLDQNSAHRIRIESLEAGVAELVSCLVNDNVRFDAATGEILNQQVITAQTRTTMAKTDGTWKVIRSAAVGLDEGVGGCWLEPEDNYPL